MIPHRRPVVFYAIGGGRMPEMSSAEKPEQRGGKTPPLDRHNLAYLSHLRVILLLSRENPGRILFL
jgi:hypothetical protein